MQNFQQNLEKLEAADTQVLGVSMDSPYANHEFAKQLGLQFPLLSDWGGKVTNQYGLFYDPYQAAYRATFLIDKSGKVTHLEMGKDAVDPEHIVLACERKKKSG